MQVATAGCQWHFQHGSEHPNLVCYSDLPQGREPKTYLVEFDEQLRLMFKKDQLAHLRAERDILTESDGLASRFLPNIRICESYKRL